MNKLTLSVLATFIIIFGGTYALLQLYQGQVAVENARIYNQTCIDHGIDLTESMMDNTTDNIAGCECRFGSYTQFLNCLCDCELKDFPVQDCHILDGCYVSEDKCYCTYSVFFE
jgi:hypothetical protein